MTYPFTDRGYFMVAQPLFRLEDIQLPEGAEKQGVSKKEASTLQSMGGFVELKY